MFWLMILSTGKIWLGKYVLTCVCFGMGYPRSARHIEPTGVFRYWYKSKYDVWQFTYEIYIARYDIHICSIKRHYILICIYAILLCWANTEIPTAWSPKWRRKQTSRGRDVTRTRSIRYLNILVQKVSNVEWQHYYSSSQLIIIYTTSGWLSDVLIW